MNMLNKNMLLVLGLLVAGGKLVVAMDGHDKGDSDDKVESMAVNSAVAAEEVGQEVPAVNSSEIEDEIEGLTMICEGDASASHEDEEHPAKRQRIEPTGVSTLDRTNLIFAEAIALFLPVGSVKALMQTSRGMQGMLRPTCRQRQFGTLVPTMSQLHDLLFPFMTGPEIGALAATSRGMNRYIMLGNFNYQRMQQLFDLLLKRNQESSKILNAQVRGVRKLLNVGRFHPAMIMQAQKFLLGEEIYWGFDLIQALVEKGQGFEEALLILDKHRTIEINSFSASYRKVMELKLLKALVEKGVAYEQVFEEALKAIMQDKCIFLRDTGLSLLKALVEKGQGIEKVIEIARNAVTCDSKWTLGLSLFQVLVQKGQNVEQQAIDVASRAVKHPALNVHQEGLKLFKALVENNHAFSQAIVAASKAIEIDNFYIPSEGLNIFKALFEKGQGFTEALQVARKVVRFYKITASIFACCILKLLVDQGQYFGEVVEILKSFLNRSQFDWPIIEILSVLLLLIKNDYVPAYDLAAKIAKLFPAESRSMEILELLKKRGFNI